MYPCQQLALLLLTHYEKQGYQAYFILILYFKHQRNRSGFDIIIFDMINTEIWHIRKYVYYIIAIILKQL